MPKVKTNRGAAKRFKRTGKGKLRRHHAFHRHLESCKSPARRRKLRQDAEVDKTNRAEVKQLLPNG